MKGLPGVGERRRHDDSRHGTPSSFAALDAASRKGIGRGFARHRAREFRAFPETIEATVPDDSDSHIVMDDGASHETQAIRDGFAKRPCWHVHVTPRTASWIDRIERVFADPRRFTGTESADDILDSVKRGRLATRKTAEIQTEISGISESGH